MAGCVKQNTYNRMCVRASYEYVCVYAILYNTHNSMHVGSTFVPASAVDTRPQAARRSLTHRQMHIGGGCVVVVVGAMWQAPPNALVAISADVVAAAQLHFW